MLARIRPRLTYANVVSTIALFVVLGGGAYATHTHKIGPQEIKKNAVKKKQLAPRAVTPPHIAQGAVRTGKIFDGAVTASKLADGVAVSGPQGPQGEPGPPGPATGAAGGDLTGSYPNPTIATGAVTSLKLADNAVNAAKVLSGSLGTVAFASSIPAARVTHTVSQNIAHNLSSKLSFNAERYDTANMHTILGSNNTRLTAPVPGIYAVTAQVEWFGNGDGRRRVLLQKNGGAAIARDDRLPVAIGSTTSQEVSTQTRLEEGDFVEVLVAQTSGGFLNVTKTNEYSPEFSMSWLAPGP